MIGYDYDFFDEDLSAVEAMYGDGYMDYPDYSEPDIPEINIPDPVISSPEPKKDSKKEVEKKPRKEAKKDPKKESKKDTKKEPQKDIKKEAKIENKEPEKKAKTEPKKDTKKESKVVPDSVNDDLILDKKMPEKEEKKVPEEKKEEPNIGFTDNEIDEIPSEIEPENVSINLVIPEDEEIEEELEEEIDENEASESLQDELEEEDDVEVIPPSNEPQIDENGVKQQYFYQEPYEEVGDAEDEDKKEIFDEIFKDKYAPILIKVLAFAAMLVVIIGIPVFLSSLGSGKRDKSETEKLQRVEAGVTTTSDNTEHYGSVGDNSYKNLEMTNHSSRFANLDELSFYLESNINATLSNEQALYNTYTSGNCSKYYYAYTLSGYIDFTDEMSHLLTANKSLYKEQGLEDRYNELSDSLDVLMVYGDSIK